MLIDFLKERKNVVQIIIVSVFLALGIGFLGQGTAEVLELDGNVNIVLGLVLIIPALILLILKLAKQRSKDIVIRVQYIIIRILII